MKKILVLVVVLAVAVWVGMRWLAPSENGPAPLPTPLADDKVQLDEPLPGSEVSSPLVVKGRARGTWFFEASFPVIIKDSEGNVLAAVPAQAQADWMTEDWVPFEVSVEFNVDDLPSNKGTLILQKDNPSGLPEFDDSREITIYFQ